MRSTCTVHKWRSHSRRLLDKPNRFKLFANMHFDSQKNRSMYDWLSSMIRCLITHLFSFLVVATQRFDRVVKRTWIATVSYVCEMSKGNYVNSSSGVRWRSHWNTSANIMQNQFTILRPIVSNRNIIWSRCSISIAARTTYNHWKNSWCWNRRIYSRVPFEISCDCAEMSTSSCEKSQIAKSLHGW